MKVILYQNIKVNNLLDYTLFHTKILSSKSKYSYKTFIILDFKAKKGPSLTSEVVLHLKKLRLYNVSIHRKFY